jgi:hypothetical protein
MPWWCWEEQEGGHRGHARALVELRGHSEGDGSRRGGGAPEMRWLLRHGMAPFVVGGPSSGGGDGWEPRACKTLTPKGFPSTSEG